MLVYCAPDRNGKPPSGRTRSNRMITCCLRDRIHHGRLTYHININTLDPGLVPDMGFPSDWFTRPIWLKLQPQEELTD